MTFWDGGSRAVAFISSPLLMAPRLSAPAGASVGAGVRNYTNLMHASDLFATTLQIAGLNLSTALPDTAVDSVGHWGALRGRAAAPPAAAVGANAASPAPAPAPAPARNAPAGNAPRSTLVHHVAGAGQQPER